MAIIDLPEGFEGPETDSLAVCGKEGMYGLASAELDDVIGERGGAGAGLEIDGWRDECFNWIRCEYDKVGSAAPLVWDFELGFRPRGVGVFTA